jgi:hypothetical protein
VNRCQLGDPGVAAIAELLKDETTVHLNTLELHDNDIGLDGDVCTSQTSCDHAVLIIQAALPLVTL